MGSPTELGGGCEGDCLGRERGLLHNRKGCFVNPPCSQAKPDAIGPSPYAISGSHPSWLFRLVLPCQSFFSTPPCWSFSPPSYPLFSLNPSNQATNVQAANIYLSNAWSPRSLSSKWRSKCWGPLVPSRTCLTQLQGGSRSYKGALALTQHCHSHVPTLLTRSGSPLGSWPSKLLFIFLQKVGYH